MPGPEVTITLPEGMSEADFAKAFASFQKSRVATAVRDKAVRAAVKDLINAHKPEYEGYVKKYMPKG